MPLHSRHAERPAAPATLDTDAAFARAPRCSRSRLASAHARRRRDKTLRVTFQAAETGFDPVRVSDYYSGTVIEAIFEPLLTYDYLARPGEARAEHGRVAAR